VGAEDPQLAVPATLALKDITRECKSVLLPFAEGMADKMMVNYYEKSGGLFGSNLFRKKKTYESRTDF